VPLSIEFTTARVTSTIVPSLYTVVINYSISTADNSNFLNLNLVLTLNVEDPLPTAQNVCDDIAADLTTRFGSTVNDVIIDSQTYHPTP